jgi:ABC-type nitrate/sulfonate/bicarbonate transport system substrate-binding protein
VPAADSDRRSVSVAFFPGAHSAPLYLALEKGTLAAAGLEVEPREVASSQEQLAAWDAGELDFLHTSADHFVRGPRPVAATLLRAEGVGELTVYLRPGGSEADPRELRWGVDSADGGFAFVLRALVEPRLGIEVGPGRLREVGGTKQRLAALLAGEVDGALLHSPFDHAAEAAGFERYCGHAELRPQPLTNACFVRIELTGTAVARAYDEALEQSRQELLAAGPREVERLLVARGLAPEQAGTAAAGAFEPLGLPLSSRPDREALLATADLRRRFSPGWEPDPALIDRLMPT